MKLHMTMVLATGLIVASHAQNIGLGTNDPTRSKLEVWGAAGNGTTTGLFGSERGISLHRNYPAVGFNEYVDSFGFRRYMATGTAAVWQYIHNDGTLALGMSLTFYPSGTDNGGLGAGTKVWNFTSNNRWQILTNGAGGSAILDVGRGTGGDGTAIFQGTNYTSYFNNSTGENTYIRGGKSSSNVILNDGVGGKVIFGNGSATVGVNTNYYVPPTTLEVRQSNGGIELVHNTYTTLPWEWRVASGSPANFYAYYAGGVRTYFSYTDGSLHPISDARVKTNIESLAPVMDRIMQLRPVTYMMKDAVTGQPRSMGFIAQEVALLFPTLTSPGMAGNPDLLGLNYTGFGVLAVKGVQEEQHQIEGLSATVGDMEKRLQAIEKKLTLTGK
ncbi:MAG: tail fiber domain-containing protein [Chitinophagaceae bacterium]